MPLFVKAIKLLMPLLLMTILFKPASAQTPPPLPSNGVLRGQVLNGTTGQPQPNLPIKLHAIQNDTTLKTLTMQADGNGNYSFDNLSTEHTMNYQVETTYQQITYLSQEPGLFTPNSTATTLNLKVYEITTDNQNIYITQMHYLVTLSPTDLQIVQIFIIGNRGAQTYIGQNGQTFTFAMPQQAQGVTFQNDTTSERFIKTEAGYVDQEAIVPGEESLSIIATYSVPYQGDTATVEVPLPADVANLSVMVQQGITLISQQVTFASNRQMQGTSFSIFRGATLPKNEPLSLKLSGLSQAAPPATMPDIPAHQAIAPSSRLSQSSLMWLILGLGVLIIGGVMGFYPYTRRANDAPATQRQRLLLLLVRLDEEFATGKLEEATYQAARTKYKAELVALES